MTEPTLSDLVAANTALVSEITEQVAKLRLAREAREKREASILAALAAINGEMVALKSAVAVELNGGTK
jgi:hypothetical protein